MKLTPLLTIIALYIVLTGCTPCAYVEDFSMDCLKSTPSNDHADGSIPVVHCEEMTSVVQEVAVELKYDKGLFLDDAKTYFNDGIHTVQMNFSTQDITTMCEARELIVDITETMLAKLNQNIILGPDFADYPFRPENLEIYIKFGTYFGTYVDPYYITWIGLEDGQVFYYTFSLNDTRKSCWAARREAYANSREIVVYERQAEQKYRDKYPTKRDIFGGRRFFSEP